MICLICRQAEIIARRTSVKFERGEFVMVVSSVPARVCPSCGEVYVDQEVTGRLLQGVDEMCESGISEEAIEYERL